jgi:hypothetical protein
MDVNTVTMDAEAAAKAFREYRAAFMAERNRIDGELMRSYKALADGKVLISLTEAIQKGGVDQVGRPNLAIARADETGIVMRRTWGGGITYQPFAGGRVTSADRRFDFPEETLPDLTEDQQTRTVRTTWNPKAEAWRQDWEARLPFIPPQYRPPLKLDNYHLLWEAEWRLTARSQRLDPMLLRQVGGDLFVVVAAWDLTEIEKLVLVR